MYPNDKPQTTNATRRSRIEVIRIPSPIPYAEAHEAQVSRRTAVEKRQAGSAMFLLEHTPVITLGRSALRQHLLRSEKELEDMGIEVCEASRGGDVTYHGPGQLVAYPILDLGRWRRSIRWYLRALEEVLIRQLADYGLKGERVEGCTGVWVDGAEVAAIGVGIHKWVTFHGIALNVATDMSRFRLIVPCGIADKRITSLQELLGDAPPMRQAMADFEAQFKIYFDE